MLSREIQTEHWPDRNLYDFPMRPIGLLRLVGLLPIGFAILFASLPAQFFWKLILPLLKGKHGGFEWIALVFLSFFVLAACMPFAIGMFIIAGRTRLVVSRDRITAAEIAGPFRWRRRILVPDLVRLEVAGALDGKGDARLSFGNRATELAASSPGFGGQAKGAVLNNLFRLGGIAAVLSSGRKMPLVLGYPADWLQEVANDISGFLRSQGAPVTVSRAAMSGSGDTVEPADTGDAIERPAGSRVVLLERANGIELTVPSAGLWRESRGLILFGMFWCLFLCVFTYAMLFGGRTASSGGTGLPGVALFLTIFWAVGLGMLSTGIHLGTRRWSLFADSAGLQVSLKSALRNRQWQWPASEIRDVRAGPSNMKVNNQPVEELQIHTRLGKKTGLLGGRDHAELTWIAALLRRTLRLTSVGTTAD